MSLIFYDVATRPPAEETACSPNPWKTRFALNFKALSYTTKFVALPDIAKVRSEMQVPACRSFADGSDFYTLPILEDPATGTKVGDSFDIAVYLHKQYPGSGGDLFPPQTLDYEFKPDNPILVPLSDCSASEFPEYARFNMMVDAAFTTHVQLTLQGFPFDPASEQGTKAEFMRRANASSWDFFDLSGEAREKTMASFRETLGGLAKLFARDASGPFLLGEKASYADLMVGAWLRMMYLTLPEEEWKQVRSWHDGIFGRLHDALDVYAKAKV